MKQIIYNIIACCAAVCLLAACQEDSTAFGDDVRTDNNRIALDFSSGNLPMGRAEAMGVELKVDHLDVLIFNEDGTKKWFERISNVDGTRSGIVFLKATKEDFDESKEYWVYVIANSSESETTFEADDFSLNNLKALEQKDENIHVTGLTNVTNAPQTFLMDGVAYLGEDQTSEPTVSTAIVLNAGEGEETKLAVVLRRAAAKIVVKINKGNDVTFDNSPAAHNAGYYLRNMPYTTSVLPNEYYEAYLTTPGRNFGSYFNWTQNVITVTTYAYAHKWLNESVLEKEVRLVVNIPMYYKDETELRGNNYYQIPISKDKILERNTYYEVEVTVNTPGAEDPSEPLELNNLTYAVRSWDEMTINIGGESERPAYLYVNEKEMEMHNIDDDNTTLWFASSSAVTVEITKVYYMNKFGQEQVLEKREPNNSESNEWGVKTTTWSNLCNIKITPDEGINGKIDVYGTIPQNNAVRYIEFTVTNETGQERNVVVAQYPLEYITNVVGWYSTRSDFGGTTYVSPGTNRYVTASSYRNKTWNYDKNSNGFFRAKYVDRNSNGTSTIYYYTWVTTDRRGNTSDSNTVQRGESSGNSNSRMYHVQITASSGTYTLGRPRITEEGITDPGKDNAKLVSPSFMIASQLGAVSPGYLSSIYANGIDMAASHCKEYVEVATDGTVYDDWRLPTRAEVDIIAKFQRIDGSAVDVVLAGLNYYSASEIVNLGQGSPGTFLRCIRDAYDDKTTTGN